MTRVGVFGAAGRMGRTVCAAIAAEPDLELVAAVDPYHAGIDLQQLGVPGTGLQVAGSADAFTATEAEVAVDFTVHDAARKNLEWCADHGIHAVVGTTGFSSQDLAKLRARFDASGANAVIAPNFSVGAVLMMRFAEMAAPLFQSAEVIELHHGDKVDAPSGTAMLTAERIAAGSSDWAPDPTEHLALDGARGAETAAGIRIHSLRLRGLVAHHEVILGAAGQILTIRHDSFDRSSFMPGVVLAVRAVPDRPGLTVGLDSLLGL